MGAFQIEFDVKGAWLSGSGMIILILLIEKLIVTGIEIGVRHMMKKIALINLLNGESEPGIVVDPSEVRGIWNFTLWAKKWWMGKTAAIPKSRSWKWMSAICAIGYLTMMATDFIIPVTLLGIHMHNTSSWMVVTTGSGIGARYHLDGNAGEEIKRLRDKIGGDALSEPVKQLLSSGMVGEQTIDENHGSTGEDYGVDEAVSYKFNPGYFVAI